MQRYLDRSPLTDGRKLHCCLYCNLWLYRIPRHMMRQHKAEPRVKLILKMGKSKQNMEFSKLRREGDYNSNILKLKEKNHNLTVVRSGKLSTAKYTVCVNCHGFFTKRTLRKHSNICNDNSKEACRKADGLKESKMYLASVLAVDSKYDKFSADVLARMQEDELSIFIKHDELLMLYGYTIYEKGGVEKFSEISNKLRNVARLVLKYREMFDAFVTTNEIIDPTHWDSIIKCIKHVVDHCGNENVGIPSLLLRLGRSLQALASAKRAVGIKTKNEDMVKDARDFLELYDGDWHIYANHALSTIASKKDKVPELLPLTEDVKKLRLFLLSEIKKITGSLKEDDQNCILTRSEFVYLQKLTLVRIITFNARRGGEPAKLKLEAWLNCDKWKRHEDIENLTDPLEQLLASRLKLVYSKGKRKKRVPTIFTDEVQEAINYLVRTREQIGVIPSNTFLFPCTTKKSSNHVRGWEVVHEIAGKAKLRKPELITSTKIRKHMATVLQLLDMNNAELEWVTEHLGHTGDVHKTWYRQEASTVELTKVAKLLIAKDKGVDFKNKKMKDLTGITFSLAFIIFSLFLFLLSDLE